MSDLLLDRAFRSRPKHVLKTRVSNRAYGLVLMYLPLAIVASMILFDCNVYSVRQAKKIGGRHFLVLAV